jgi:hypothetical protein
MTIGAWKPFSEQTESGEADTFRLPRAAPRGELPPRPVGVWAYPAEMGVRLRLRISSLTSYPLSALPFLLDGRLDPRPYFRGLDYYRW